MAASSQLLLCENLKVINQLAVSNATFLCKILDVVGVLNYHFQESSNIVIWLDLLNINQHLVLELGFHWLENHLKLHSKFWCLFDFYCTTILLPTEI
jgi:adenine-specific DNA methylase